MPSARYKLLGTYRTPTFRYGQRVEDERRGEVRIVGLPSSNVPARRVDQHDRTPQERTLEDVNKSNSDAVARLKERGHFIESPNGKLYAYANVNPGGVSMIRVIDSATCKLVATGMINSVVAPLEFTDDGVASREADGELQLRVPLKRRTGPDGAVFEIPSSEKKDSVPGVKSPSDDQRYARGKDALDFIERCKPTWSDSHLDIQFGVSLATEKRKFREGERVPLAVVVRNVGDETLKVSLSADFLANVPQVFDSQCKSVLIAQVFASGSVPVYRETLKPGAAFCFPHAGLGLGENPRPGEIEWNPCLAKPITGVYSLKLYQSIAVEPLDESKPGESAEFTSGSIEFEFVDRSGPG